MVLTFLLFPPPLILVLLLLRLYEEQNSNNEVKHIIIISSCSCFFSSRKRDLTEVKLGLDVTAEVAAHAGVAEGPVAGSGGALYPLLLGVVHVLTAQTHLSAHCTHTRTHTYTHTHVCTHTRTYVRTHACTHSRARAHTHILFTVPSHSRTAHQQSSTAKEIDGD